MKKYLSWLVPGLMILMFVVFVVFSQKEPAMSAQGGIFSTIRQVLVGTGTTPRTATSTFNLVYLTSATTTYTLNVEGVDQVNLNLFAIASSTLDNLYWYYGFANATTSDSDTWFREDSSSASGAVTTHNTAQMTHIWNPASTGTSTKNVLISNVNSKYMQIGFWSIVSTSTLKLWVEAVTSKPY